MWTDTRQRYIIVSSKINRISLHHICVYEHLKKNIFNIYLYKICQTANDPRSISQHTIVNTGNSRYTHNNRARAILITTHNNHITRVIYNSPAAAHTDLRRSDNSRERIAPYKIPLLKRTTSKSTISRKNK